MIVTEVEALDLASQLTRELVTAYEAEDATISTIVNALLAFQVLTPAITVGTIDASYADLTRSIKVDGDTIWRALLRLRDTVGGYIYVDNDRQLQWDTSLGEDKGQQIRYRKNLKGIEREIDYTQLFNRIYAYGAGEGTARIKLSDAEGQDEDYIEDETSQTDWDGIYPGVFVDRSITHPDTLLAWANLLLADYKDPPIYYRIDTVDLSQSEDLGFSFEALQLGSTITVIDEDLGIDVKVIVVTIEHPDLLHPEQMTLELANRTKDITDTLAEVYDRQQFDHHIATTIGAGQVIVKGTFTVIDWATDGETTIDGANIETGTVTLNHLNFVALTSADGTNDIIATINASEEGLEIDADKVSVNAGKRIFRQDSIPTSNSEGDLWFDSNDDNKLYRAASAGADEIKAGEWILVRDEQINTNSGNITANANQISLNVTSITNLDGRVTSAEADIIVNAGNILLKVDADGVIAAINISSEEVKIDAAKITLAGVVAVDDDIQSSNYVADTSGWIIHGDGSAEFNSVVVRGTVYATDGEFSGTLKTSTIDAEETLTVNGMISAGGGDVILDTQGLKLIGGGEDSPGAVRFYDGEDLAGFIHYCSVYGVIHLQTEGIPFYLLSDDEVYIQSLDDFGVVADNAYITASIGNVELDADEQIVMSTSDSDIIIDPGGGDFAPYNVGGADLGTNTYYFDTVECITLDDSHSPVKELSNPLEALRKMRSVKKLLTVEEARLIGLGKKTIKMLEQAGGELEVDWKDKDSFPEEILSRPTQEDYEKAEADYLKRLEHYNTINLKRAKRGLGLLPKRPEPAQPVISTKVFDEIWMIIRAVQKLADRVDEIETRFN
jgi:phage minor structural protein